MRNSIKVRHTDTQINVRITKAVISYSKLACDCNYHMRCTHVREKTEYNKRINSRSFWAPESESDSTSKCMTPTLGTRPVSSVGLATNWRLSTVNNQTHPDSSFDRQRFLYGRLFICFSSCIFHSCIFHNCYLLLLFPLLHIPPVRSTPASSTPAISTPAVFCSFHSCIFHSRIFSAPDERTDRQTSTAYTALA